MPSKPSVKKAAKPSANTVQPDAPDASKTSHPPTLIAHDVDPLMRQTTGPMRLVGGLSREDQLPTSLVPRPELPIAVPLSVQLQTSPGAACHGNSHPVNLLALITCAGWPVADLNEDHFSVMEHFSVPGQQGTFSNNIVSFRNAGSGAYLLQLKPFGGAPWQGGQYLAQVLVSSPDERHGQAVAKFIVR